MYNPKTFCNMYKWQATNMNTWIKNLNLWYVLNKKGNFVFLNSFMFMSLFLSHLQIPSHAFHLKRNLLSMLQQCFSKENNKIKLKS
jgi:hypothetical protein